MNYQPETVLVKNLKLNDKVYLSSDILNIIDSLKTTKLSVNAAGEYTEPTDISPLSIITTDKASYNNIAQTDKLLDNAIYLVETDRIDAYGHTIENVAEPVANTDAANKYYVDSVISANQHAFVASTCYAPEKLTDDQCSYVQWSEFILAEQFGELADNTVDGTTVFINTMKFLSRKDNFPGETGPMYAEIVEDPGNETDITRFLPVQNGRSLNTAICQAGKLMTFNFDNVQLNINTTYAIKFVNDVGILQKVHIRMVKNTNLKTMYNATSPSMTTGGISIRLLGTANSGSIAQSLLMPDGNTKDLYAVCIENGKLISKKL